MSQVYKKCPLQQFFFLKVFHLRHFYCKVIHSVLKNISFTDCCAISMPKRWYINFIITHVRKVMSFDYSNFLRYTFSVLFRSSRPEVFLRKGVLKICSKFAEEHPCRSVISIKLRSKTYLSCKTYLFHGTVHLLKNVRNI